MSSNRSTVAVGPGEGHPRAAGARQPVDPGGLGGDVDVGPAGLLRIEGDHDRFGCVERAVLLLVELPEHHPVGHSHHRPLAHGEAASRVTRRVRGDRRRRRAARAAEPPGVVADADPCLGGDVESAPLDGDGAGHGAALVEVRAVVDLAPAGVAHDAVLEVRLVQADPGEVERDAVGVLRAGESERAQRLDDLEGEGADGDVVDARAQPPGPAQVVLLRSTVTQAKPSMTSVFG